jgi:Ca-activated chloride channel family protein
MNRSPHRSAARAALVAATLVNLLLIAAIVTPRYARGAPPDPDSIGSGELLWNGPHGWAPLPIVDMQISIRVTGVMARGIVAQTFSNPTAEVIEAVYLFPLPDRAAVDAMEIRIGERRVVAVVQERAQARKTYERARAEGRKAGLLDQKRPNLFQSRLANINPGESVIVRLEYVGEVEYGEGVFSLAFPLTYTPRHVPRSQNDADGEAASAVNGPFLPRSGPSVPRASLEVFLDFGVPLEFVRSSSHDIQSVREGSARRLFLEDGPVVADRDFLLRWKVREEEMPGGMVFIEDRPDGRYALAMLIPPVERTEPGWGLPTETLFILDVSGSMEGASIDQAKGALYTALDRLRPGDAFNILKFNDRNAPFRSRLVPARWAELQEAKLWIGGLRASGGTEILPALVRGLEMMSEADPWPVRRIIVITDGAISNEDQVFAEVSRSLGGGRVHLIGIGSAPNRSLMRRLARFGRGTFEIVSSLGEVQSRMDAFMARIDRPVLTDLSMEWRGARPLEIFPEALPDLHAGEPLVFSMRFASSGGEAKAILTGRTGEGPIRVELGISGNAPTGSGVATRWARRKVERLSDAVRMGTEEEMVRPEVIDVATKFNLVTRYTSLVAVEQVPSADGRWTTRHVANASPRGSVFLGELPRGGTSGRLLLLAGLLLTSIGISLSLAWRMAR